MRRLHDDTDGGAARFPGLDLLLQWCVSVQRLLMPGGSCPQTQTLNLVSPPEADAFSPLLLSFGAELICPRPPGAHWPCSLRVGPLAASGSWALEKLLLRDCLQPPALPAQFQGKGKPIPCLDHSESVSVSSAS